MRVQTIDNVTHILQFFETTLFVLHFFNFFTQTYDVLLHFLVCTQIALPDLEKLVISFAQIVSFMFDF